MRLTDPPLFITIAAGCDLAAHRERNMIAFLYLQSGGPTSVIGRTMLAVCDEARRLGVQLFGAYFGFKGLIERKLVDLSRLPLAHLVAVCSGPSAALGSSRTLPSVEECDIILAIFRELGIVGILVNGGNDSAESIRVLLAHAVQIGQPLVAIYLAKTIDCDLRAGHHSPGYPSAARYVAKQFIWLNADVNAMPRIHGAGTMGRNNGSLVAAAALAKHYPDDGPHVIFLPERPFTPLEFQSAIRSAVQTYGKCLFAFSEGIRNPEVFYWEGKEKGKPMLYSDWLNYRLGLQAGADEHGNTKLSGSGKLGDYLASLAGPIGKEFGELEVRVETFGYAQRSCDDQVVELDEREAYAVGAIGMRHALEGKSGAVIVSAPCQYDLVPIEAVAKEAREMPFEFIAQNGFGITGAFLEFARSLVGTLAYPVRLEHIAVETPLLAAAE